MMCATCAISGSKPGVHGHKLSADMDWIWPAVAVWDIRRWNGLLRGAERRSFATAAPPPAIRA